MDLIPQFTAVIAVLTLLGATLWWLRTRGFAAFAPVKKRSSAKRLECLERLSLSQQHTLHLVRLGDTALLVASSPSGCSLVQSTPFREIQTAEEQGQ
jgi:flagellar biogenesis protein FliO